MKFVAILCLNYVFSLVTNKLADDKLLICINNLY